MNKILFVLIISIMLCFIGCKKSPKDFEEDDNENKAETEAEEVLEEKPAPIMKYVVRYKAPDLSTESAECNTFIADDTAVTCYNVNGTGKNRWYMGSVVVEEK